MCDKNANSFFLLDFIFILSIKYLLKYMANIIVFFKKKKNISFLLLNIEIGFIMTDRMNF